MNTKTLDGKEYLLTEGEGGKLTLTPLIKQPEPHTPEAGDVLERRGWTLLVDASGGTTVIKSPNNCKTVGTNTGDYNYFGDSENLGKFSEVYVKIADVHSCIVSCNHQGSTVMDYESLRKIGIITD